MAHLRDDPERDRGQIILVTGFALAVAFVSLALVMNSVIYTENLATRSENSKASDAVTITHDVTEGTAEILRYVNDNNETSYASLRANLTSGIDSVSNATVSHQVTTGKAVGIALLDHHKGTRVGQTDGSRDFTADDGSEDWTLVENVDAVGSAQFGIDDMRSPDLLPTSEATFNVTAENATTGDTWNLTLVNGSAAVQPVDEYAVYVTDGSGVEHDCGTRTGEFWVNSIADGVDCSGTKYELGSGMGAVDRIAFENGANVTEGQYTVLVRNASASMSDAEANALYDASGGSPFYERQIYDATIHVEYEEARMTYGTDATITAGERDD